ncbi:MAG: tetratricopeptide repeat protein [Alphaproteobacteria bacterium]|nr:tetratricopeptide repeat protein [Alphaproteobacteria bacterium]
MSSFELVVILGLLVLGVGLLYTVVAPKRTLTPKTAAARPAKALEPAPPPDVQDLLRRADQHIGEGALDRASLLLSQATALEPDRPGLFFVQSRLLHAQGDPVKAVKTLEKACAARPEVTSWHCVRGHLLLELERPDLAAEAFRQALDLDPDDADGQAGLEEALRRGGGA